MEKFRIAIATDDGKTFIDRHFGDAEFYDIYDITENSCDYVQRVNNSTEEEDGHADSKKAKGIIGILKKEGVDGAVSKIFGPNIKRIRKKFVCVIMDDATIQSSLKKLQENIPLMIAELEKGEERKHLVIRG